MFCSKSWLPCPHAKPKTLRRGFGSSPGDTSSGSSRISCTAPCRVTEQYHGLILALLASPNPQPWGCHLSLDRESLTATLGVPQSSHFLILIHELHVLSSLETRMPHRTVPNAQVQVDDTEIALPLFTNSVELSQVFAHSLPSPGTEWHCHWTSPVNQEKP